MEEVKVRIYTDGSTKPTNPGPAGFGVVVLFDGELNSKIHEYIGEATNNIAEIKAVLSSLEFLSDLGMEWNDITIVTDSQYAIGLFEKNWRARANVELVKKIRAKLEEFPNLCFEWVRGHDGDKYNEMADKLAKFAVDSEAKLA